MCTSPRAISAEIRKMSATGRRPPSRGVHAMRSRRGPARQITGDHNGRVAVLPAIDAPSRYSDGRPAAQHPGLPRGRSRAAFAAGEDVDRHLAVKLAVIPEIDALVACAVEPLPDLEAVLEDISCLKLSIH